MVRAPPSSFGEEASLVSGSAAKRPADGTRGWCWGGTRDDSALGRQGRPSPPLPWPQGQGGRHGHSMT